MGPAQKILTLSFNPVNGDGHLMICDILFVKNFCELFIIHIDVRITGWVDVLFEFIYKKSVLNSSDLFRHRLDNSAEAT
jgi:hypothetical protein